MDHTPPAFHLYMPEEPLLNHPEGPRHAAYHSGDLAFVFGNVDKVGVHWNDADRTLSALMVKYWTNFARSGNPNGPDTPEWPEFSRATLTTQVLNGAPGPVAGIRRERVDLLAEALPR